MSPIHGYRALAHPLSQIAAAEELISQVHGFVQDEWSMMFSDPPPDEDDLEEMWPGTILASLARLGLRFEVASKMVPFNKREDESFWTNRFQGSLLEALFWNWAATVQKELNLDPRLLADALRWTDLVFVPDREGVVAEAHALVVRADPRSAYDTERRWDALHSKHWKRTATSTGRHKREAQRGEGPRKARPAVIDRAAVVLREARTALSPEDLARRLKHKNLASLTAALHQAVKHGKPKRLLGCLASDGAGKYRWRDVESES